MHTDRHRLFNDKHRYFLNIISLKKSVFISVYLRFQELTHYEIKLKLFVKFTDNEFEEERYYG